MAWITIVGSVCQAVAVRRRVSGVAKFGLTPRSRGLLGQDEAPSYRMIARELRLTEGAVKMAAHRLRARYRERLR